MTKKLIIIAILIPLVFSGCARLMVHGYLRAVMNNGETDQFVVDGFKDEVIRPYAIMDYKILNTGPYKIQQVKLGTIVRTEITFKSKAGTPLPKIVEFSLTNNYKIRDVE